MQRLAARIGGLHGTLVGQTGGEAPFVERQVLVPVAADLELTASGFPAGARESFQSAVSWPIQVILPALPRSGGSTRVS